MYTMVLNVVDLPRSLVSIKAKKQPDDSTWSSNIQKTAMTKIENKLGADLFPIRTS